MILQFAVEKQSNYYVINYLNLAVGWWKQAGTTFNLSFWISVNGSGLGRFVGLIYLSLQSQVHVVKQGWPVCCLSYVDLVWISPEAVIFGMCHMSASAAFRD